MIILPPEGIAKTLLQEEHIVERTQGCWEVERLVSGLRDNAKTKLGDALIETSNYFGFFSLYSGRLWGGAWGYVWGKRAQLVHLWVDEGARGYGLGSFLLRKFEAKCWQEGASCLILYSADYEAPRFYLERGYTLLTQIPGAMDTQIDNLMIKYRTEAHAVAPTPLGEEEHTSFRQTQ